MSQKKTEEVSSLKESADISASTATKEADRAKKEADRAAQNANKVDMSNYYDKAKSDELLANKADLVSGKVPTNQLPEMDYVPNSGVGNEANKIPKYNADGHLVFPSGGQLWVD